MAVVGHCNYPHWVYALYVCTDTCIGCHLRFSSRGVGGGKRDNYRVKVGKDCIIVSYQPRIT